MSKKINGCYGSFNADILDGALKTYCRKKKMQLKVFFDKVFKLYPYNWYRSIRIDQYADKGDIKRLCEIVKLDFEALEFKEGHKKTDRLFMKPQEEFTQLSMDFGDIGEYPAKTNTLDSLTPIKENSEKDMLFDLIDSVKSGKIESVTFRYMGIKITLDND